MVAAKVKEYQKVTQPYLYAMPDVMYDVYDVKGYEQVLNTLGQEVEINYQMYLTSLERPLPFFLDTITVEKDAVRFQWDVSFDFDNEALTYTFELARDYTFKTTLNKQGNLKLPQRRPASGSRPVFHAGVRQERIRPNPDRPGILRGSERREALWRPVLLYPPRWHAGGGIAHGRKQAALPA